MCNAWKYENQTIAFFYLKSVKVALNFPVLLVIVLAVSISKCVGRIMASAQFWLNSHWAAEQKVCMSTVVSRNCIFSLNLERWYVGKRQRLKKDADVKRKELRDATTDIRGLFNDTGGWCSTQAEIQGVVDKYFRGLFSSADPLFADMDKILRYVRPCLSTSMSSYLDSNFSPDEVRRAVFDMAPTKTSGPDGFPAMFYHKFWLVIGTEVAKAFLGVLNDGQGLEVVNETLITLIPKVKKADRITDYWPISLCNVLYKIVAKTLANRFRGVPGAVNSETQSSFIPGRLITDNAIVGFECMHALRYRKKRKVGAMAIKLDMSKVYDIVE
ncbi:hypothetical protein Ddye_014921 [Dipteronia dyeriana]|uniref:Reverse transcriptase n=1 Tax=Dipteronia dyeriana TaxID=168575 RepID=A0AAD9WYT9_9ROSI|nr:hypothetical protein Ddye_014921 [Dipteronia dyeriana]